MYLLVCIQSASFVFGLFIVFWWRGSLDLRVALAGVYWLITTVALAGTTLLLRLEQYQIGKGGRL
jgi:hypothetical protein